MSFQKVKFKLILSPKSARLSQLVFKVRYPFPT